MAGEEQTNTNTDPDGVENEAVEPAQTEAAPESEQAAASHEQRNQWILFGILVGILLGVVLTIAVLRPLIFNRIVPAVMGDFLTPTPAVVEEGVTLDEEEPAVEPEPTETNTETGENEIFIPAASSGNGEAEPVEEGVSEPVVEETAVPPAPTPEQRTHTVQVGDNLTKISQLYGVTVEEIMAANSLPNADLISVGQILIIPTN